MTADDWAVLVDKLIVAMMLVVIVLMATNQLGV